MLKRVLFSRRNCFLRCFSASHLHLETNTYNGIAPKKKDRKRPSVSFDGSNILNSIPKNAEVVAEFSSSKLEKRIQELTNMPEDQLESLLKELENQDEEASRTLQKDDIMQMEVSLKEKNPRSVKVFWRNVDIRELEQHPMWFHILVDDRPVKASSSKEKLVVPTKDYALACAREWAEQEGHINNLLMPLTDIASGAMTIAPRGINARIEYLLRFFQNDNCFFRTPNIQYKQDELIAPISDWFERVFDIETPRIVGIGHPHITPADVQKVHETLLAMNLNQFQIVALCVVAQFTASLMLPLALFNKVVSIDNTFAINEAEERHNIDLHGKIKGYHDIREADVRVKVCAAAVAWDIVCGLSLTQCSCVLGQTNESLTDLW